VLISGFKLFAFFTSFPCVVFTLLVDRILVDLPVGDFSNVEHLKEVMDNGQVGEDQAQDGICCARYAGA
jgi:hypothetical protein